MSKETIIGFDIEKRELTQEEKTRDVTLDRFREFHNKACEDFCDQVGHMINAKILTGFLMGKRPEISHQLLDAINKDADALELKYVYEENIENNTEEYLYIEEIFYSDLAEFINLTVHLKERTNQILIQVSEHYKD